MARARDARSCVGCRSQAWVIMSHKPKGGRMQPGSGSTRKKKTEQKKKTKTTKRKNIMKKKEDCLEKETCEDEEEEEEGR